MVVSDSRLLTISSTPRALASKRTLRTLLNVLLAKALELVQNSLTSCTPNSPDSDFQIQLHQGKKSLISLPSHHFLHLPAKLFLRASLDVFKLELKKSPTSSKVKCSKTTHYNSSINRSEGVIRGCPQKANMTDSCMQTGSCKEHICFYLVLL